MQNDNAAQSPSSVKRWFKRSLGVLLFTVMLGFCAILITPGWVQGGGLPVFDGAAVTQMIQQAVLMAQQLEKLVAQVSLLKQQVQTMTGHYGMGSFGPSVDAWGGSSWANIADMVGKGMNPGDAAQVIAYKRTLAKYSTEYPSLPSELQPGVPRIKAAYLETYSDSMVGMSMGESTFNQVNAALANVQTLKGQIDQTENLKSAIDLNAAIGVQVAQINGESLRTQAAQLRLQAATKNEQTNGAAAQTEFFAE